MDAIRNILLAGLGAVGYSQDKLKEVVSGLIEKGQLTKEQGEKVISEWVQRGTEEREKISERVEGEVKKLIGKLPMISREEFDALAVRVEKLEKDSGGAAE